MKKETIAFVYKWTHIPTLKWYVGSRTKIGCHPNDGYICSSKIVKPLIESNPEEWKREIISTGTKEAMTELEYEILESVDAARDIRSFNKSNGNPPHWLQSKVKPSKLNPIETPDGIFDNLRATANHYNVKPHTIRIWIKKKSNQFKYVNPQIDQRDKKKIKEKKKEDRKKIIELQILRKTIPGFATKEKSDRMKELWKDPVWVENRKTKLGV
jgi:hypothetical protein